MSQFGLIAIFPIKFIFKAFLLCELAQNLSISDDLDNDIDDIIQVNYRTKEVTSYFYQD